MRKHAVLDGLAAQRVDRRLLGDAVLERLRDGEQLVQPHYSSLICDYREDVALEREKLEFLAKKSVDGFIYMPLGNQEDIVARLLERSLPVILIDRPLPGLACDSRCSEDLVQESAAPSST